MAVIAGIPAGLPAAADPYVSIATAIAICGANSVPTGAVFLLVGEFRLAHLVRLFPYPVMRLPCGIRMAVVQRRVLAMALRLAA